MADRDVERDCTTQRFVETLRRLADALEAGDSFRIQVANGRFTIPNDANWIVQRDERGFPLVTPQDDGSIGANNCKVIDVAQERTEAFEASPL